MPITFERQWSPRDVMDLSKLYVTERSGRFTALVKTHFVSSSWKPGPVNWRPGSTHSHVPVVHHPLAFVQVQQVQADRIPRNLELNKNNKDIILFVDLLLPITKDGIQAPLREMSAQDTREQRERRRENIYKANNSIG